MPVEKKGVVMTQHNRLDFAKFEEFVTCVLTANSIHLLCGFVQGHGNPGTQEILQRKSEFHLFAHSHGIV